MKKERYREEGFNGFVEELINSSRLEGKEAGIAKLMLDKGYDSLSEKQKFVFDRAIENTQLMNVNAAAKIYLGAKCLKHLTTEATAVIANT